MTAIAPDSTRMFAEAAESAEAVARQQRANAGVIAALAAQLRVTPPRGVATCARGSSDHAATYAKYLIETRLPLLVASLAPSTMSIYHARPALGGALAIGISQSGRSPDLLAAMLAACDGGATTVALVNNADSPLAALVDTPLPLHAGAETSVAATKSYIATLAAIAQLVAAWAEDTALAEALAGLPVLLGDAWRQDWTPLVDTLADSRGLYVVGRGVGLGVAQEMALKLKETCGLHAEAFSTAELRHGPMALVGPGFPLVVLRPSDEAAEGVDAMIEEMAARGGPVLVAGGDAEGATALPVAPAHPALEPILAVQSFYRAANALSVRRGFDPDRPPYLAKVTETV